MSDSFHGRRIMTALSAMGAFLEEVGDASTTPPPSGLPPPSGFRALPAGFRPPAAMLQAPTAAMLQAIPRTPPGSPRTSRSRTPSVRNVPAPRTPPCAPPAHLLVDHARVEIRPSVAGWLTDAPQEDRVIAGLPILYQNTLSWLEVNFGPAPAVGASEELWSPDLESTVSALGSVCHEEFFFEFAGRRRCPIQHDPH